MMFPSPAHAVMIRAAAAGMLLLAAGCATQRTSFSDRTINGHHLAYARCAVHQAFASAESELPALEQARAAVGRCERERVAIQERLIKENAGKPGAASFVAGYMDEMRNTMVKEIAAQMGRIQELRDKAIEQEEKRKGSRRI